MIKNRSNLNLQSTLQVPFLTSPDVLAVLATQAQLEYEKEPWKKKKQHTTALQDKVELGIKLKPCIRLVRLKFELTNQDSEGGKNCTVLKKP